MAFINEEPPFFFWNELGSGIYAEAAKARGENIRLMISLEMLGSYSEQPGSQSYPPLLRHIYLDRANFIAMVSNWASRKELQQLVTAFYRNAAYHTTGDTPEKLNYPAMARVVDGLFNALTALELQ